MKKLILIPMLLLSVSLSGCHEDIISEQSAKQIALNDAQVEENEINFTVQGKEDDEYHYCFESNDYTYEYEIDFDGTIDKKEILIKETSPINNYDQIITDDQAIEAALGYFHFSRDEITNLEVELDDDDKTIYFDIDFVKDNHKYSISIDAINSTPTNADVD